MPIEQANNTILNLPAKAIFLRIRNYIKKFPAIMTGNHRLG